MKITKYPMLVDNYIANSPSVTGYSKQNIIESLIKLTKTFYKNQQWNTYRWQDASQYEELNALEHREWRWELIRRNEIYRRIWICSTLGIRIPKSPSLEKLSQDIFKMVWLADPNIGALDLRKANAEWAQSEDDFFPPSFESSVRFSEDTKHLRLILHDEGLRDLEFEHFGVFYMKFDPKESIKGQIQYISEYLEHEGRIWGGSDVDKKRERVSLWPNYLRAYDAYEAGLSHSMVGKLIWDNPNPHRARDARDSARELVRNCLLVI